MLGTAVFVVNRYRPLRLISTQHGAVWWSANGLDPIEVNPPLRETANAEIGAVVRAAVGVRDEQLARVGRPELRPERAGTLRDERRARCRIQQPVAADVEAVDERRRDPGAGQ